MNVLLRTLLPVTLIALAAGCSKTDNAAPDATASAAAQPATAPSPGGMAATPTTTGPAMQSAPAAADGQQPATPAAAGSEKQAARTVEVQATDAMKFSVTRIEAAPGEQLQIKLVNVGTLPKEAMGHNLVLLKKDADPQAYANAALTAKATDYLPPNLNNQVVAATKLLGPKQTDTISFTVPSEPGEYTYLCSFPAHFVAGMKGVLVVR